MRDISIYSTGLCHCSVCVPEEMRANEIADRVNQIHPTGIDSRWELSKDKTFADDSPNPQVCGTDPTRRHHLLVC